MVYGLCDLCRMHNLMDSLEEHHEQNTPKPLFSREGNRGIKKKEQFPKLATHVCGRATNVNTAI